MAPKVEPHGLEQVPGTIIAEDGSPQIPLTLTSGVELEFMHFQDTVAGLAQEVTPTVDEFALSNPDSGRRNVHAALSKPMTAKCATCEKNMEFQLDLNPIVGFGVQTAHDPTYKKWTVGIDETIYVTALEESKFRDDFESVLMTGVEVTSRVLDASSGRKSNDQERAPTHECHITADAEIRAVAERLNESYSSTSSLRDSRAAVNSSCGFHVHIGNGSKGFPLQTVKNIISLYVAHEMAIDSMHSTDRITGSKLGLSSKAEVARDPRGHVNVMLSGDVYNVPWSTHFLHSAFEHTHGLGNAAISADHIDDPGRYPDKAFQAKPELVATSKAFDVPSWLTLIENAQCISDLRDLQGYYRRLSTINLGNLRDFCNEDIEGHLRSQAKMTIEFRQAAGTLQPAEILAWHDVLVALVEYAHNTPPYEIRRRCLKNWDSTKFDTLDFLRLIGISRTSDTYQHYKSKLGLSKNSDESYVQQVREAERKAAFTHGHGDVFLPMLAEFVRGRCDGMEPNNVGKRVADKFHAGGYGQFTKGMLKRLGVKKSRREELTVGYRVEEPFAEENEETAESKDDVSVEAWNDGGVDDGLKDLDPENRYTWDIDDDEMSGT